MSKTLMILAHPNIENSLGNKIISESFAQLAHTEVRDLTQLYPNFKIDIASEQKALLNADIIIFQYPLFWYNVPAILKEWIDQVFQYGFAFGQDSYQLKGKKIIVSFTMGGSNKDYPKEIVEKILFPFQGLAKYCKMDYLGEVLSNDISAHSEEAKNEAIQISTNHAKQLTKIIEEN